MKRLSVVVALVFGLLTTVTSSATHTDDTYPEEICFPDVPGIEYCIEHDMVYYYLTDPTNSTGQQMWIGEAVWLWGYPLTEARFERNADGHCVYTQWFERAVFELHQVYARHASDHKLRRLGAEMRGDTEFEPQLCTVEDYFNEQ